MKSLKGFLKFLGYTLLLLIGLGSAQKFPQWFAPYLLANYPYLVIPVILLIMGGFLLASRKGLRDKIKKVFVNVFRELNKNSRFLIPKNKITRLVIGISVITITSLFFGSKLQKERQSGLEEKNKVMLQKDRMAGYKKFLESESAEIVEKTDDFDNSNTFTLNIYSQNKMPFDTPPSWGMSSGSDEAFERAKLKVTCKKYPPTTPNAKNGFIGDIYGWTDYKLELTPSAPIINNGKVEMKWDFMQPQIHYLSEMRNKSMFSFNLYRGDLVKRLDKHMELKIRYETTKGTQIAEFALYPRVISDLVEKCSSEIPKN